MLGLLFGDYLRSLRRLRPSNKVQREPPPPEPLQYEADHYRKLATSWSLFTVLYAPDVGLEDAPVGDEFLEWLNTNYVEPSTEEGDHLSSLDKPWQDGNFWPYIAR